MKPIFAVVALCFGLAVAWDNSWDGPLHKECPAWWSFSRIRSQHDNHREDRLYQFDCRQNGVSPFQCFWTSYVNDWDKVMNFNCPQNYVVTGVTSYHDNHREDRRFKFKCCALASSKMGLCHMTPTINDWDQYMDYNVPHDSVIRGFKSWHDNHKEDRRWQVSVCRKI